MFKRKNVVPTWFQNVDLGQKRVYDIKWAFIIIMVFVFSLIVFLGIYFYPTAINDYYVFQRVRDLFLLPN